MDPLLCDANAFFDAPPSQRADAVRSALDVFGESFEAVSLEGRLVRHVATGISFVVIPGGRFVMGMTDDDLREAEDTFDVGPPLDAWLREATHHARPTREVRVAPFVCGYAPLSADDVARLTSGRNARDTLSRGDALRVAQDAGFRLPSEGELEWLRRDARGLRFVLDVANDDEGALRGASHSRLAVDGLLLAEWAADDWHETYEGAPPDASAWLGGDPAGCYRAGTFLPTQHPSEQLECLAALRRVGRDEDGLTPDVSTRLALSLPAEAPAAGSSGLVRLAGP